MILSNFTDRVQFLIRFAYIGSRFHGVQEQPGLKTVLGDLRTRIEGVAMQKARGLAVAARTDRGVNALENYVTFFLKPPLDVDQFIKAVAKHRDDGLFAVSIKQVPAKVHARGNAHGKTYRYYILDGCDSFTHQDQQLVWRVAPMLCIERMRMAATFLVGVMDFSSLRGGGCQAGTTIKHIVSIDIERCSNGTISIEIYGNAFLRKMLRNLVGLLVEIGAGLKSSTSIPHVMAQKHRDAAGIMAPPHGLFLVKVNFIPTLVKHI